MNKILKSFFITLASLFALSGCSSLFDLVDNDINGDGVVSRGEASLAAYTRSMAGPTTTAYSSLLAKQQGFAGIKSFAVVSANPTIDSTISNHDSTGEFATASIYLAPNLGSLKIDAPGIHITVPRSVPPRTIVVNGKNYTLHTFGSDAPIGGGFIGTRAGQFNGQYASLAYFFDTTVYANDGSFNGYNSFAFVPNGLETPDDRMPTQSANYAGIYYLLEGTNLQELGFSGTADFAAGVLNGGLGSGITRSTYLAIIEGNKFVGTASALGSNALSGEIIGAFYGPNAEEIAGVAHGTAAGNGAAGYFIGNKN